MTGIEESVAPVKLAAQAAADKRGRQIVAFDVSEQLNITDVFLLVSASNEPQVGAIVDAIEERLVSEGLKPVRREGDRENRWVLLDYLDFVVHIQHTEERTLYNLERLWKDCPLIDLELELAEVEPEE